MVLLYCSVFGKTMENTREYRRIDLVNTKKRAERLAADPSYRAFHTFTEKLLAVERYTTKVELNKPIYTGASVLVLSKLLMLDFHYGYMKEKYPDEKSRLHFSDTDSLLYSIETDNIYDDMWRDRDEFDISDYPDGHQLFQGRKELLDPVTNLVDPKKLKAEKNKNKKKVGKMKDEAKGNIILEFVGLRAKAYAYLQESWDNDSQEWGVEEKKKLKGIKKCVVKNKILFEHYKHCLQGGQDMYATMRTFRSYNHKLNTIVQVKKALARFDDKRFILADGVRTNAHGHIDNIIEWIANI